MSADSNSTMLQTSGSFDIQNLQDIRTPFGVVLSGVYKRSFAYVTIKDRLPIILTKVVDLLSRNKEDLVKVYGQKASDDVKSIIGFISKLKNEMVTNKVLKPLDLLHDIPNNDADEWNKYLEKRTELENGIPTWFNTAWLYCECYMYRALAQEFLKMKTLHSYDPFEQQKQKAFLDSMMSMEALSIHILTIIRASESTNTSEKKAELFKLLKLNLWGNKCDLSLSAGAELSQTANPVDVLPTLDNDILIDHSSFVWDVLSKEGCSCTDIVDMILDNAGYELFTDICLALFLISHNLARKIRFYVKRYPWYVSDATKKDFDWILLSMSSSTNENIRALYDLASSYLQNSQWTVEEEDYWTGPYDYAAMREKDKALYEKLSQAKVIIFKGDLNYRKLVGDINWKYTTEFTHALRGFHPSHILSLRTVKSDVCVGLAPDVAETLFEKDESWMFTGQFGLIQATVDHNG